MYFKPGFQRRVVGGRVWVMGCGCRLDVRLCLLGTAFVLLSSSGRANADDYRFERLWPSSNVSYGFSSPVSVQVDDLGNLYVSDNYWIVKFNENGRYLGSTYVTAPFDDALGQPGVPGSAGFKVIDLALDTRGNFFMIYGTNPTTPFPAVGACNQKGEQLGAILTDGSDSTTPAFLPTCISVAKSGLIYVGSATGTYLFDLESGYLGHLPNVIAHKDMVIDEDGYLFIDGTSKYSPSGEALPFHFDWTGPGGVSYGNPTGYMAVGPGGTVYAGNDYGDIVRWTQPADDVLVIMNYPLPGGTGEIFGLAADKRGYVYLVDQGASSIRKFTRNGLLTGSIGSASSAPGYLTAPWGFSRDASGNFFVADYLNRRINKYSPTGQFLSVWKQYPEFAEDPFEDREPDACLVDAAGNVFVAEILPRLSGGVVTKYNMAGVEQFEAIPTVDARDWAMHPNGDVYFVGSGGVYIINGSSGSISGTPVMTLPSGTARTIGLSPTGSIAYIGSTDTIAEFLWDGTAWVDSGVVFTPHTGASYRGMDVDAAGNLYITGTGEDKLYKYAPDGTLITTIGETGTDPGQFSFPRDVIVDAIGHVYVLDTEAARVQEFSPVAAVANNKAVIVAGGGPYAGNRLWDATVATARIAHEALLYRGFTHDSIRLLSPDANGVNVDAEATRANIQEALTVWAGQSPTSDPIDDVVVYMVDHGGVDKFRINENELLFDTDLVAWLSALQSQISGKIYLVYDACESGSLLQNLANSGRVIMTSTTPGEQAYFVSGGALSFSNHFWMQILNGDPLGPAFSRARDAVEISFQKAQLDADGNGTPNEPGDLTALQSAFLGSGVPQGITDPVIDTVGGDGTISGVNDGVIWADFTDDSGINRVWAVITPPTYEQQSSTIAVTELATVELLPDGTGRWEGTYLDFVTPGDYTVDIYASNRAGQIAGPYQTTVTVGAPPTRKVLIVAGGSDASPEWPAYEWLAAWVYRSLKIQGYAPEDIRYLSQTITADVDGIATLASVEDALDTWASASTRDFTLCLVGQGSTNGFHLGDAEFLAWPVLDGWLDALHQDIPGIVTVACDASGSGSVISGLRPTAGQKRILVGSAGSGQPATFANNGVVSFSRYFWVETALGATVGEAFSTAAKAMNSAAQQRAELDDNGDGVFSTKIDGALAQQYSIGTGIELSGDEPLIGAISSAQTLTPEEIQATIWVEISALLSLKEVVCLITKPDGLTQVEIELLSVAQGRYEAAIDIFDAFGTYAVTVTAVDLRDNTSAPAKTVVHKPFPEGTPPDEYEADDTLELAKPITVNGFPDQRHTFHVQGDVDCVVFEEVAGAIVTVETSNLGLGCDTQIDVFGPVSVKSPIASNDDAGLGDFSSYVSFVVPADGRYLVQVYYSTKGAGDGYGDDTGYSLRVWREAAPTLNSNLKVHVQYNGAYVPGATLNLVPGNGDVNSTYNNIAVPPGGPWEVSLEGQSYTLTVQAPHFQTYSGPVILAAGQSKQETVPLVSNVGKVKVTLGPQDCVNAGAQWRLDSGLWQSSGVTLENVPQGAHQIQFKTVAGWFTPDTINITLAPEQVLERSGLYQRPGSIQCALTPADAVTAGAQWRIEDGAWNNSGVEVTGLKPQDYIVSFSQVPGWVTPLPQRVTVGGGNKANTAGDYIRATLDKPQNLQASDGTFTDKVRVTWSAVANATAYRVYRANLANPGAAQMLADVASTQHDDFSAAAPTEITIPASGCGGSPSTEFEVNSHVYWVQALGAGSTVSDWSNPDSGHRGTGTKGLDARAFEVALPIGSIAPGVRAALPDDALAVRLRADTPLDTQSVQMSVDVSMNSPYEVKWMEVPLSAGNDAWVTVTPKSNWAEGESIRLWATARTIDGELVRSIAVTFEVIDVSEAMNVPVLVGAIGEPFVAEIRGPATVSILANLHQPNEEDMSTLCLYAYIADGPHAGWHPVEQVVGLLDPVGTALTASHSPSEPAIALFHSATLQWGRRQDDTIPAPDLSGARMPAAIGGVIVLVLAAVSLVFGGMQLRKTKNLDLP
ncbi:MAG: hypothetical protein AMXMBFR84_18600 [Candidatus Hydrogenedentota bacterium]